MDSFYSMEECDRMQTTDFTITQFFWHPIILLLKQCE
jgi:hypothetical protein